MPDLKATFIQSSLATYMNDVEVAMKAAAQRAGVGVTGRALKSLAYTAVQNGAGSGIATLTFDEAIRFVDMGAGRGHPLGGLRSTKTTLLSQNKTGLIQVKDKVRKPKKIYSKIAYGKLTWLQNQLLYGYTEEVIAQLKTEMENHANNPA